jgi:hypothetical protein
MTRLKYVARAGVEGYRTPLYMRLRAENARMKIAPGIRS